MNTITRTIKTYLTLSLLASTLYGAQSAERWSLGFVGGLVTSNQADLNTLVTRANTRVGGISTPQFGNAYEVGGTFGIRFNQSVFALLFRPTYYFASVTGSGSGGTYSHSLSGYVFMPLIRAYILEASSTHLYLQGGIGYGMMGVKSQEAAATVDANGSSFGYQGGIGVQFCFGQRYQHCPFAEGNVRYLPVQRNLVTASAGSFSTATNPSYSQTLVGRELELDGLDATTTMSGVQGFIGYQYNF